ncbi:hypothetical protein CHU98_g3520 [Xylaria longipes]|nr:hypothetical protein CHU98_g3520 [Xylaria longipes]
MVAVGDGDGGGLVVYRREWERGGLETERGSPEGGQSVGGATGYRYWLTGGSPTVRTLPSIDSAEGLLSLVLSLQARVAGSVDSLCGQSDQRGLQYKCLQRRTTQSPRPCSVGAVRCGALGILFSTQCPAIPVGQGWRLSKSDRKQARSRQIQQSKAALTLDWERSLGRLDGALKLIASFRSCWVLTVPNHPSKKHQSKVFPVAVTGYWWVAALFGAFQRSKAKVTRGVGYPTVFDNTHRSAHVRLMTPSSQSGSVLCAVLGRSRQVAVSQSTRLLGCRQNTDANTTTSHAASSPGAQVPIWGHSNKGACISQHPEWPQWWGPEGANPARAVHWTMQYPPTVSASTMESSMRSRE